jgi:hypothetical protein
MRRAAYNSRCGGTFATPELLLEERSLTNSEAPSGYDRATGTFETTVHPQPPYDSAGGITLARMTIDKRFSGDLEGTSVVEMLSAGTSVKGSAGYVAIERVTGILKGRDGSFVLQQTGTMTRGVPQLAVTIVPDSGTGALAGIAGQMAIAIVGGKHFYTLDYRTDEPA